MMNKLTPLLLALLMLLAACGKKPADPAISAEPPSVNTPEATERPSPTPEPEPITNPLTGETISREIDAYRPYAVMLNNISVALPQCGISKADILYEVLAEGEITRFEAIFSDLNGVGAIGSMRSSRPYYIELALSYDAIYVHAGGSEQAYSDISAKGVDNIDGVRGAYSSEIFYRDPSRQAHGIEHSLFTSSDKILEYTAKLGYEPEHADAFDYGLSFTETPELGAAAAPAASVNVSFAGLKNTRFSYRADTGCYTGSQYDTALTDGTTSEAVQFKNLLVLFSDSKVLDSYGRRSFDLDGTGTGYFICGGRSVPVKWSRAGTGAPFTYTREDGAPLELGIGKSYIGIVPTGSAITME
jgi:hypothetical protein